jgi:hypothetical protein
MSSRDNALPTLSYRQSELGEIFVVNRIGVTGSVRIIDVGLVGHGLDIADVAVEMFKPGIDILRIETFRENDTSTNSIISVISVGWGVWAKGGFVGHLRELA